MKVLTTLIVVIAFLLHQQSDAGVTRVQVKSDDGGKDWIYEMIGDILVNRFREGDQPRIAVDGRKRIFGSVSTPRPWNGGIVPYFISPQFTDTERQNILRASAQITDETKKCIKFVPRSGQADYIKFSKSAHTCSSNMGRMGGQQTILLSPRCASNPSLRSVTHELLHSLGFHHEQSRSDRDKYVRIHLSNVKMNHEFNFDRARVTNNEVTVFDYDSILIYGPMDFSSNGSPTMSAVRPEVVLKSNKERTKLTQLDLDKIRKLYNC